LCVFLGLRLYLFLLVGEVWWSILLIPPYIFIVLVVCSAGVAVVGVLSVGGYVLRAMYWLCFLVVLCGFVLYYGILVLFLQRCIVYDRVLCLHCAGGLIGTWLVCLSTMSFLL
jgi:hypothetical protein